MSTRSAKDRLAAAQGLTFPESFRGFQYERIAVVLVIAVAAVTLIDILSPRLRKLLI